eukprot:3935977-Pleurochrysis_carterae.AAC.1
MNQPWYKNDSSDDDGCAGMMAMRSGFSKAPTAEEISILDGMDSDDKEDISCEAEPSEPTAPTPFENDSTAASAPMHVSGANKMGRGKYKRVNGKGIRNDWERESKLRLGDIENGSILVAENCSKDCEFGKRCIQNTCTVTLLKRCAAVTF